MYWSAISKFGSAAQEYLVACSLSQNGPVMKGLGYIYRLGGLHGMMTKYGLSRGDLLVFRCATIYANMPRSVPALTAGGRFFMCTYMTFVD